MLTSTLAAKRPQRVGWKRRGMCCRRAGSSRVLLQRAALAIAMAGFASYWVSAHLDIGLGATLPVCTSGRHSCYKMKQLTAPNWGGGCAGQHWSKLCLAQGYSLFALIKKETVLTQF